MARISNQTAYPQIAILDTDDFLILTDKENANMTKTVTVGQLQTKFGIDTLSYTRTISQSQLLAFNAGGTLELIAAPGANKVIVPLSISTFLDHGGTDYNFNTAPVFNIGTNAVVSLFTTSLNGTADNYYNYTPGSPLLTDANLPLNLIADPAVTVTQGDGALKLNIFYRVVDFT
jgi:hypothetical protein